MFTIKGLQETYGEILSRLKENKNFYFTRFGDGDCTLAQGTQRSPVGNNQMIPSDTFASEMREVFCLDAANFLKSISIQGICEDEVWFDGGGATNIDKNFINTFPLRSYYDERVFCYHLLHKPDEFESLIRDHIRPKKVMYVGGNSRQAMEKIYGPLAVYIQTPPKSCNTVLEDIWQQVESNIDGIELVLPSAGAVTKIINKRMFKKGIDIISLDFGSIHDAYDGKHTRSWIRNEKEKLEEFVKRF